MAATTQGLAVVYTPVYGSHRSLQRTSKINHPQRPLTGAGRARAGPPQPFAALEGKKKKRERKKEISTIATAVMCASASCRKAEPTLMARWLPERSHLPVLANISSSAAFLKLSGGPLNGRRDDGRGLPLIPPRLSPAVHCPFQWLIYGTT